MSTETDRILIPYDEARALLGAIGRTKFHELIDDGHLVRVKIGRRGFIVAKSLADYVDRLSEAATA